MITLAFALVALLVAIRAHRRATRALARVDDPWARDRFAERNGGAR